jgi:hypothetical protein
VPRYELLVDGRARDRVRSDGEARVWVQAYRLEHEQDDPDATHVQVMRLSALSWLTGGTLVPLDELLGAPLSAAP